MKYEWWFANIRQINDSKKRQLRGMMHTAEELYYIEEKKIKNLEFINEKDLAALKNAQKDSQWEQEYERFLKKEIAFIPFWHDKYPSKLLEIAAPPYALYVKGKLPDENRAAVAIVGARRCTPYGEQMAIEFAQELAANGVQIISGMAKGIDGAGQRGALNEGGDSYAVLGSGVDTCYPREHRGLYMDLQKNGGILSEQPAGSPPLREYFPARNRIISGLSDVVLIMEAKERSGSLITADCAMEQGKDVYALPGPINSALSRGCNYLIRQGAGILLSVEDLLSEMKMSGYIKEGNNRKKSDKNEKVLENEEFIVYSCLDLYPKSIHVLQDQINMEPAQLMDHLIALELKGYIRETAKNYYIKVK